MTDRAEAVIVTALRTPVGKAPHGSLSAVRPDDLARRILQAVIERTPGLDPAQVDDVVLGCAFPEGEQGLNLARMASLSAGFPTSVPGVTVNRYCASSLEAIAIAATRIETGMADCIVAGGVESMSRVPAMGYRPSPHPDLARSHPEYYMSMGQTAEEVARRCHVSRDDQDAFALQSHRRAAEALDSGAFVEETVPIPLPDGRTFNADEGVRRDTSPERLAALRPAFVQGGTVTAGNASQTSDGASAVVLMSDRLALSLSLKPLGVFRGYAVTGVDPDVMGLGPVRAIPMALSRAGLSIGDVDLIELNEAFASQTLVVIRTLGLDMAHVNVHGGAIALGHPLGATGSKLTATLLHEMPRRKARYGVVSMCIGGGMGAAGVFEGLPPASA